MTAATAEIHHDDLAQARLVPADNVRASLVARMAGRFGVDSNKLLHTLKQTAFRQRQNDPEASTEEMMALLIIADQYKLNPFTKELFAFFDKKRGGIVPVVSVDGWARIVNEHSQYDGVEFVYSPEVVQHKSRTCHVWIDCMIYRKDRSRPTVVREFFYEVVRNADFSTPWDTHPSRMHRHKTFIQCARLAFGFAGIYDEDEAQRIVEGTVIDVPSQVQGSAGLKARLAGPLPTAAAEPTEAPQANAAAAPQSAPTQPPASETPPERNAKKSTKAKTVTISLPDATAPLDSWMASLKGTAPTERIAWMEQARKLAPAEYQDSLEQAFDELAFGG